MVEFYDFNPRTLYQEKKKCTNEYIFRVCASKLSKHNKVEAIFLFSHGSNNISEFYLLKTPRKAEITGFYEKEKEFYCKIDSPFNYTNNSDSLNRGYIIEKIYLCKYEQNEKPVYIYIGTCQWNI